jgi:two-component system, NarL family, sensor kinase
MQIIVSARSILLIVPLLLMSCKTEKDEQESLLKQETIELADKITNSLRTSDTLGISVLINNLQCLMDRIPDSGAKGKAGYVSGNYYTHIKKYDLARLRYELAYKIVNGLDSLEGKQLRAYTLFNNSLMHYENGDFEEVLNLCLEAEATFHELNEYSGLALACNRIGGVFLQLNDKEKAASYNQKAWSSANRTDDINVRLVIMNGYGNYLLHAHGDSAEMALLIYDKARQLAEESGNKKIVSDSWYNQAYYHSQKKDYKPALELYHKAYNWAVAGNNNYDICDALYKIGLMHYYLEEYNTSRDILLKVLVMAEEAGYKILERNACDVLGFLEPKTGNHREAVNYLNKNLDLVYEIFSDESRNKINFLEAKYQARKRENEIIIQKERIRLQGLMILSGIVFLALTMISILFMVRNYRNKQIISSQHSEIQKKIISDLEKDKELLVARSMLKGEEAERSRIARDLHDGLGGMLSGVKLTLSNMKNRYVIDSETSELFANALEMINSSVIELRRVAHNMMPEILLYSGLQSALESFCQPLTHNNKLKVIFQSYGISKRLNQHFELTLYRIAQELINNSLKHSGGDEIIVELVQDDSRISLNIRDNGRGINMETLKFSSGSGIPNIHTRVNSYGGIFDIFSEPDHGSEFLVSFEDITHLEK